MIDKLQIQNFGIFKDYDWNKSIGKDISFSRLNILYGRNYSGKTTLSRILKCIEDKELHKNFTNAEFSVVLKDSTEITQDSLFELNENLQVRVYNTDFVDSNLSWLHKEDGTIEPFTILGAINVELDAKIKDIEKTLGSEEEKAGLIYEISQKTEQEELVKRDFAKKSKALETKLKNKANNEIKVDSSLFVSTPQKKTYQTNDIKRDVQTVLQDIEKYIIPSEIIDKKKETLKEQTKPEIETKLTESKPNFENHYSIVKDFVGMKITTNQPLQELIDDSLLQEWVRTGIEQHKDKRETCGFCGSKLPSDLWMKLDAHFSKESEELRNKLKKQIDILDNAKSNISSFIVLKKELFYSSLYSKYDDLLLKWESAINIYVQNLDTLINQLQKRFDDIFNPFELTRIEDNSPDILSIIKSFNELIDENNDRSKNLSTEQNAIRYSLRLNNVAKFAEDIDYASCVDEIDKLEVLVTKGKKDIEEKTNIIKRFSEEKRSLERQAKDESRGAELINQHLSNFFGHDDLKLVSQGETPYMSFKITRGGIDAKNLSEGECSLISFCYFIAKMEDEMSDELNNQKLVVYIDDPISSLDSNHIFYMYSLIDTILAKQKKYGQLFISTHNLDFLKFLKRITVPDGNKENINHFLIERRQKQNETRSFIVSMPAHLKDFVTEFNYLFNEIHKVYKECKGDKKQLIANTYNQFYNLPNNVRKFLECYLFFKYPNNDDLFTNLNRLFDGHIPCLINRIVNEYSHLTYIERGWKPVDVEEAEECATIIIEKLKEKDIEQYEALLKSVN